MLDAKKSVVYGYLPPYKDLARLFRGFYLEAPRITSRRV
jgi:hypothetical protein